jgi:hypothetical protein
MLAAAVTGTSACVYFNSYYNASKLFDQGRQDVEQGSQSTGRATLATSIEKAEAVVAADPDSRWADDAVRIIVRARLLREEWQEAVETSHRLLGYALTREDTAEVAGYMGIARLHLGDLSAADTLLSFSLAEEENSQRRSLLLYNRALAHARLGAHRTRRAARRCRLRRCGGDGACSDHDAQPGGCRGAGRCRDGSTSGRDESGDGPAGAG